MKNTLDRQFSDFIRKARGDQTFTKFARKVGVSESTLHRLEQCQQSVTLGRLDQILRRLKRRLRDVFPDA